MTESDNPAEDKFYNYGAGPELKDVDVNHRRKWLLATVLILQLAHFMVVEVSDDFPMVSSIYKLISGVNSTNGESSKNNTTIELPKGYANYFRWVLLSTLLVAVCVTELVFRITLFIDELKEPCFTDRYGANFKKCAVMVLGSFKRQRNHVGFLVVPLYILSTLNYPAIPLIVDCCYLAFYYGPFLMISYMIVSTFLPRISLAELRSLASKKSPNIGYGLAYLYYHGYLSIFLQDMIASLYEDRELSEKCFKRLFILIPEDGSLTIFVRKLDKKTPPVLKARAGHRARAYSTEIYEIENGYYLLQVPRPIYVMKEMSQRDGCGISRAELEPQIKLFYNTLIYLLEKFPETCCMKERVGNVSYRVPAFQIIRYRCDRKQAESNGSLLYSRSDSNHLSEVENRVLQAVKFAKTCNGAAPVEDKKERRFNEEIHYALVGNLNSNKTSSVLPFITSFVVQCGIIAVLFVWIVTLCVWKQYISIINAVIVIVLLTCVTALTHIVLWGTIVFISEFFSANYDACYPSLRRCIGKCYGHTKLPGGVIVNMLYIAMASGVLFIITIAYIRVPLLPVVAIASLLAGVLLAQHLCSNLVSDVEIASAAYRNKLNVYKGLAWNYVIWLRDLIPAVTGTLNRNPRPEELADVCRRLMFLIPTDAYCPKELGLPNGKGPITYVGQTDITEIKGTDGNSRSCQVSKYKVYDSTTFKHCLAEYPALLLTLYDMCRCGQIDRDDLAHHVKLFYSEVKALLEDCPGIHQDGRWLAEFILYKPEFESTVFEGGDMYDYERVCNHGQEINDQDICEKCEANTEKISRILGGEIGNLS